jgi:uncharacterized RDD family membrane protein YckC
VVLNKQKKEKGARKGMPGKKVVKTRKGAGGADKGTASGEIKASVRVREVELNPVEQLNEREILGDASNEITYALVHASFWDRVLSGFIDLVIIWVFMLLLAVFPNAPPVAMAFYAFVLAFAYPAIFTGVFGATVGKAMRNLVVMDASLKRGEIGLLRGFARDFAGKLITLLSLGLGFLVVLTDDRNQALHDKLAGTVVMKRVFM